MTLLQKKTGSRLCRLKENGTYLGKKRNERKSANIVDFFEERR
jgi:hypothetical protein